MTPTLTLSADRRVPALAATLAVHLALVLLWRFAQPVPELEQRTESMQWLRLVPPTSPPPPRPPAAAAVPRVKIDQHTRGPRSQVTVNEAAAPAEPPQQPARTELDEVPAPSSARGNDETLMERARRSVGGVDRELRKERHRNLITAPAMTAHMRMQKGMEQANELAPPRWYEPAKVKEIIDPGGYGRRRYRVITARGTYCMTYESNHAPDGIDTMKNGIRPKITNCDKDEQPATEQKW